MSSWQAQALVGDKYTTSDGDQTLWYWLDDFYQWDGSQWSPVAEYEIRAVINDWYPARFGPNPELTASKVTSVLSSLRDACALPSDLRDRDPLKDARPGTFRADRMLALSLSGYNWDPDTMFGKRCSLSVDYGPAGAELNARESTPEFFNLSSLDVTYPPGPLEYDSRAHPEWTKFLKSLWPDEDDSIRLLQEFMGYVASGDTSRHKILLMVGPKRGGKSTIARVMRALVGEKNAAAPTMDSLTGDFGLHSLVGKSVAIIGDARFGGKNADVLAGRLLSISGEDTIEINRKYADSIQGRLPVRFVVISNSVPEIHDVSGALASRFVKLQLSKSFAGREDWRLEVKLLRELPAILLWALEGEKRLRANGEFTRPEASESMEATMAELSSPLSVFVQDFVTVEPTAETNTKDAYRSYTSWCSENGMRPVHASRFGRDLRAALADVGVTLGISARKRDGERYRVYTGVKVREPGVFEGIFSLWGVLP